MDGGSGKATISGTGDTHSITVMVVIVVILLGFFCYGFLCDCEFLVYFMFRFQEFLSLNSHINLCY